jgi:hypothetical protein
VVIVPLDRHLSAAGITCAPLPKAVAQAGRQIFARALAAGPYPPPAGNRPPGPSPNPAANPAVANPAFANPAVTNPAFANPDVAKPVVNPDEMDRAHD